MLPFQLGHLFRKQSTKMRPSQRCWARFGPEYDNTLLWCKFFRAEDAKCVPDLSLSALPQEITDAADRTKDSLQSEAARVRILR
jgi:hypothetical protein